MDLFAFKRRRSSLVRVGNTPLGAELPIRVQSMANVPTMDTEAAVEQSIRMIEAGAEYLRFTAQGVKEATNLGEIRKSLLARGFDQPMVADIHFNPKAAFEALKHVEKVRINPGNFAEIPLKGRQADETYFAEAAAHVDKVFSSFLDEAKRLQRAIRIGVNHGSLSERMMLKYGDTPRGMVMSAMEYLELCRQHDFHDVVISMKASNVLVMTEAVRLLVATMDQVDMHYPLHLGVTEAGEGEDGRIKSAVGIGSLLIDGIGDTIRVSLSEEPEAELPVCKSLVKLVAERHSVDLPSSTDAAAHRRDYLQRNETYSLGCIGAKSVPVVLAMANSQKEFHDHQALQADFFIDANKLYDNALTATPDVDPIWADASMFSPEFMELLRSNPKSIVLLQSTTANPLAEWRKAFLQLERAKLRTPVILHRHYSCEDADTLRLEASIDMGSLLLEGRANGLLITAETISALTCVQIAYSILQATRLRMSKTEYISCPGCGRTLYNLQETLARIKAATSHLKSLKIGVMGCIVNGPGEMADADYGYVGSAPGCVDLYKEKECLMRAIPQEKAVESLIELIRQHGDWHDAST